MKVGNSTTALAVFMIIALMVFGSRATADVLTVTAKGTIAPVCSISVIKALPTANFAVSGNISGSALVNCNTGFVMTATSANGAVKNDASVSPGFTNVLPYTLNIVVPLTPWPGAPAAGFLSVGCKSAQLIAGSSSCSLSPGGSGASSGGKPAIGSTASMTLIWGIPTTPRMIAGAYHDTITISVAAAP